MKPAFDQLFLLGLLSASIHWLVARSEIAKPIWSRARGVVDKLLRCPACSGYWLGGLITWMGVHPFGDVFVPGWIVGSGVSWWTFFVKTQLAGLAALFLTPVFEAVLIWGLRESAVVDEKYGPGVQTGEIDTDNHALTESGEVTPNERPQRND